MEKTPAGSGAGDEPGFGDYSSNFEPGGTGGREVVHVALVQMSRDRQTGGKPLRRRAGMVLIIFISSRPPCTTYIQYVTIVPDRCGKGGLFYPSGSCLAPSRREDDNN